MNHLPCSRLWGLWRCVHANFDDILDAITIALIKRHIIQIMDSKMDSGYVGPGESCDQALEDHYDVMRELSPSEVLGVMDQLLSHEVCYRHGWLHNFCTVILN
jgi:hypothetical protein